MAKIFKGKEFNERLDLRDPVESESVLPHLPARGLGGVIDREVLQAGDQASQIIREAREDAAQIRMEARALLAKVQEDRERAVEEGRERGYQEGLQAGLEMLVRVKELRHKLFLDNEREMVKLVFEIAKKLIGREFSENDKAIMNVIRLALGDAVGDKIVVRLNPQDYETVKKNERELMLSLEGVKTLGLREDESVQVGGCVVDTEIGTVDAQLDTQLNAIKKALGLTLA